MNIVIAPDSYKESLTALEVAQAIEAGFKEILPDANYYKIPMADGGEGTVKAIVDATNGDIINLTVTGPLGHPVNAFLGLTGDKQTAIIEVAAAAGLHLVPGQQRDPRVTTSFGVGELIQHALNLNVKKIILGLGGSATNDGGLGLLQALGVQFYDQHNQLITSHGGIALKTLKSLDISQVNPKLYQTSIEIACDVDNPLCGVHGASFVFAPQKGANSIDIIKELDACLAQLANVIEQQFNTNIINMPGIGAAGGMSAGLVSIFNAVLRPGIDIVINVTGLKNYLVNAKLVITGEGRIDSQTIHGKTPIGVAKAAKKFNLPVIGIAGCLSQDCRIVHEHGIDAVYSVINKTCQLDEAYKEAYENIKLTARNIAKTLIILQ